ncbi:MAG: single-stranded DNA-binding protein, partial [Fibrobacter sp.]|nr:single-stranded DNA-binding protein [Fibrobacter sp.]
MADINTVTIIGRLVRDEELSYTAGGMAVGKISLAINRSVKRDGEWQNEPNFFDVTIFGKQAEGLKQYLTKGKQIGVTGFLKQDRWTDPQGQSRT